MNATAYIPFFLLAVQHAPLSSRLRLDIDLFHRDTNVGCRLPRKHTWSFQQSAQFHLAHSPMAIPNLSLQTYFSNFILTFCLLSLVLYLEISSATIPQSPFPPTSRPSNPASSIPQFRITPMSYIRACEHHHLLIYEYFPSRPYSIDI